MILLIIFLRLLEDAPSEDGTGNAYRRRCGATGNQKNGKRKGCFIHVVECTKRVSI